MGYRAIVILVLGALGLALATSLWGFVADLAAASSLRMRAQIAADAAALAAVAESGPYGKGEHERAAASFADANGARLLKCMCDPGATAVQVRVAVDEVVADARAIFDPELLLPGISTYSGEGLHPLLQTSLNRLLAASRGAVGVTSGRRNSEQQAELWAGAVAHYGDPEIADDWVARPGTSMHERGLAVDLGGDLALAARLVEHLGLPLHRPLEHEPHHFELLQ